MGGDAERRPRIVIALLLAVIIWLFGIGAPGRLTGSPRTRRAMGEASAETRRQR